LRAVSRWCLPQRGQIEERVRGRGKRALPLTLAYIHTITLQARVHASATPARDDSPIFFSTFSA
jgi:hypothetical protein